MRRLLKVFGVAVAVICCVFVALGLWSYISGIPNPSDHEMMSEFSGDRTTFEQLLQMIGQEPHVDRVANDFIWVDGARIPEASERPRYLTDARWNSYRTMFRRLHLDAGWARRDDGTIALLRSDWGLVVGGWGKSFVWSREPISSALAPGDRRSTDQACVGQKEGCWGYKQLAPHWYIEFDLN